MENVTLVVCMIASVMAAVFSLVLLITKPGKDKQNDNIKNIIESEQRIREDVTGSIKTMGDMMSKSQIDKFTMINGTISNFNKSLEERFKTLEVTNEQKLDGIRDAMNKQLTTLREENSARLESIQNTVDEKLQKTLEDKMAKSYKAVSDQLEAVYKGLGEMQTLAAGVGDLKKVLSNVKSRGIMGEYQLEGILEEILAPEQYEKNIVVVPGSGKPVEFAVKLPGEDGRSVFLPIDSKFPGDAYHDLRDAYEQGDPVVIEGAFKVLESRIKVFAKDIKDKYVEPPHTTNFAIMFLPFEGLYAEVVNRGLVEVLRREYFVSIAGPSTLAALLNSLQMGFRTIAIQKRSNEVWQLLGAVRSEFDKFETILSATQKRLNSVSDDLDKLVGVRTRAINRKLRQVEYVEGDSAETLLLE